MQKILELNSVYSSNVFTFSELWALKIFKQNVWMPIQDLVSAANIKHVSRRICSHRYKYGPFEAHWWSLTGILTRRITSIVVLTLH